MLLEDLHWADPASLELLRHVAPHLRQWSILLLATYRVDELTRRHPFSSSCRRWCARRKDCGSICGALTPMPCARSSRLATVSRPQDEARLVAYLDQHADGNPFFATEILRALEEEGFLREADGGWSLGEIDRVVVPAFLRQVIDGRVARLGEDVREPLAMAAVIGQEVPLALWAKLAGSTTRRCWRSSSGRSRRISWPPNGTAPASASSTPSPARRSTRASCRRAAASGTGRSPRR